MTDVLVGCKSVNFSNIYMRKESMELLKTKCKELFPDSDEKFVKAKVHSLRASYRRELIKSKSTTGSAQSDVY